MEETILTTPEQPVQPVPNKPRKKRSRKKKIVIGIALVLVGIFAAKQIIALVRGPAPLTVSTELVATGDLERTLASTGTLVSGKIMTVVSPVSAPLKEVNVALGKKVTEGELLFTYDTTDLLRANRTAAAAAASGALQKQDTLSASGTAQSQFSEAAANLNNLAVQKDQAAATVASLTSQYDAIADKTSAAAVSLKTALDAATADYQAQMNALTSAKTVYDAAKTGVLSDNAKKQLDYGQVAASVTLEKARADLKNGKAGVKAPMSGVISNLSATAGTMAPEYGALCVLESMEDVRVEIALSRYDLEKVAVGQKATITSLGKTYEGEVLSIDSVATTKTTGNGTTAAYVRAQIKIDQPGDTLRLGLEANVKIHTGAVKGAVTVPIGAVNTDVNGQFCYVIEQGKSVRRVVKTGLSNDTHIEILDGVAVGDELIIDPQNVSTEGIAVTGMVPVSTSGSTNGSTNGSAAGEVTMTAAVG
ncbi:MAG: efflux RND transporter periplasmic adaptor subunit [Pygmaiobacter sp.]